MAHVDKPTLWWGCSAAPGAMTHLFEISEPDDCKWHFTHENPMVRWDRVPQREKVTVRLQLLGYGRDSDARLFCQWAAVISSQEILDSSTH